jgi:Flp pilus assembly protein protease CpaA
MGMILIPAFLILVILVIAIFFSLKNGHRTSATCLAVVGGFIFYYVVFPFYFYSH